MKDPYEYDPDEWNDDENDEGYHVGGKRARSNDDDDWSEIINNYNSSMDSEYPGWRV
jgi:hypothetical protein